MKIEVNRTIKTDKSTIGELHIDGAFFCFTLEDVVRPEGVKIDGQTAIPAGTYRVIIDDSVRFGKPMPHILDVPGFDGIRIHSGNTSMDTAGCLLVGYKKDVDTIYESKMAFQDFFKKLQQAVNNKESVIITIL